MKSKIALIVAAFAALTLPAHSQVSTFNGSSSNDYQTGANWTPSGVPNLSTGGTALINNGSAVTYNPGGDLAISNGGTLEISNGSWTQINGGAWIQMGQQASGTGIGNGHILVNGGTFNQGTSSNSPFNITGTGNTFTITSGSANFTNILDARPGIQYNFNGGSTSVGAHNFVVDGTQGGGQGPGNVSIMAGTVTVGNDFQLNPGLGSFTMSGGTLNIGVEADFNALTGILMTGGTMNITNLFTMVNGPTGATFNLAGGLVNDQAAVFDGWYAASAASPFNFTTASTGILEFNNNNLSEVQGWVNSGAISYNGATNAAAFSVTQVGTEISVQLAVPEPSTYAMFGLGAFGLLFLHRKRVS
jgi:PEP-CTERM motif